MKAAVLFTIKIFLLNFIIYVFSISLVNYFWAPDFDLKFLLISSAIICFLFTLYHLYKHIREVKKLHHRNLEASDFRVHQVLNLQIPLNRAQVLHKLQTNFPAKAWEVATEHDTIRLKTNFSWKSFGEKVQIQIKKLNNELSEISIESRPINPLTIWDYGKNQENILYLKNLLTA